MARALGVSEGDVLDALAELTATGAVSRVGPVFQPGTIGISTLAAMAVPASQLERVAALVNTYPEVNHNYEREHRLNLWFVITAGSEKRIQDILDDIEERTGIAVMSLPMQEAYHIDLGFRLVWE
jgi:DNA-binding Lrp family transcriptional regulator